MSVSKTIPEDIKKYTQKKIFDGGFCERLKEERLRLGLSQEEFGKLGGVGKLTQLKYEKGTHSPSIDYLHTLEDSGADINILYILTGSLWPKTEEAENARPINPDLLAACLNVIQHYGDGCVVPMTAKDLSTLSSTLYRAVADKPNWDVDSLQEASIHLFSGWLIGRSGQ